MKGSFLVSKYSYNPIVVAWKSQYHYNKWHFVGSTIPMFGSILQLEFPAQHKGHCLSGTVVWLHDTYQQFLNAFETNLVNHSLHTLLMHRFTNGTAESTTIFVPNITSSLSHKTYLFFDFVFQIRKCALFDLFSLQMYHVSWQEASELCLSVAGHLPVINSRDEQNEILAMFKFSQHLPSTEAIFIGFSTRVGNVLRIQWTDNSSSGFQYFQNTLMGKCARTSFACSALSYQSHLFEPDHSCVYNCSKYFMRKVCSMQKFLYPVQPSISFSSCTVLFLANFAAPDWVNIHCDEMLLSRIVCEINSKQINENSTNVKPESMTCPTSSVQSANVCLSFAWWDIGRINITSMPAGLCKKTGRQLLHSDRLHRVFSLASLGATFPPILETVNMTWFKTHTIKEHLSFHKRTVQALELNKATGALACCENMSSTSVPATTLKCVTLEYVSKMSICDGTADCFVHPVDEDICACSSPEDNTQYCEVILNNAHKPYCFKKSKNCVVHFPSSQATTVLSSKQEAQMYTKTTLDFKCESNRGTLKPLLVNDLVPDCGPLGDDEPLLILLSVEGLVTPCADSLQISCRLGHPKCYHIHETCFYQLDPQNNLIPCRTGGHLQNCKQFECNINFKCPNFYCVLWSYVCDGKRDCPQGDDEKSYLCHNYTCSSLFKCKGNQLRCLHLAHVCDGVHDCNLGDDELFCYLNCVHGCSCLASTMTCSDLSSVPHANSLHFSIYVKNCSVHKKLVPETMFPAAIFLVLREINILCACCYKFPVQIKLLGLQGNRIAELKRYCFPFNLHTEMLMLDFNQIAKVERHSFFNLSKLWMLNLTGNPIRVLESNIMLSRAVPIIVRITVSETSQIHPHVFKKANILLLIANHYSLCCYLSPHAKCAPKLPWFLDCGDLLRNSQRKFVLICVAAVIVTVNLVSCLSHLFSRSAIMSYTTTITTICVNNTLCGLYLIIVWIADTVYSSKGSYVFFEKKWQSNGFCILALDILFICVVFAQLVLIFLSFTRLKVVVSPIGSNVKKTKYVLKWITALALQVSILGSTLTCALVLTDPMVPNQLCLPFVSFSGYSLITLICTVLFVLIDIVSTIVIVVMHACLVSAVVQSEHAFKDSRSRASEHSISGLILQLSSITLCNLFGWLPSAVIFLAALMMRQFPVEVVLWLTALGIPSYPICCPTIFIFTQVKVMCKTTAKP